MLILTLDSSYLSIHVNNSYGTCLLSDCCLLLGILPWIFQPWVSQKQTIIVFQLLSCLWKSTLVV